MLGKVLPVVNNANDSAAQPLADYLDAVLEAGFGSLANHLYQVTHADDSAG